MSAIGQATGTRSTRALIDRWLPLAVVAVVAIWSVVELGGLLFVNHTTGAELYGPLVAVLAVAAGVASVWLLWTRRRHTFATVALLVLWTVVALGGIAGVVAHVVGPDPAHGPVDTRPRPTTAPLVFTVLGVAGGLAVIYGQRRAPANPDGR